MQASEGNAPPPGAPSSEPGLLPSRLGRYEIQSAIGSGMMGVVYKAWDPLLDRLVALKVLRLDVPLPEGERQVVEQRFLREASLAAGLSHPNIVLVHDVGRDPDTNAPFMALEYLEGRTLAEVASSVLPEWREALRLTARLAHALQHAHSHGVIHRDIKPSNVMLLPSGEPKILDFGIAKAVGGQLTAAGESWGTPSYMSPEQAMASVVDGRSDLFSLGSVLYELLTGQRAFSASGMAQVMARVIHEEPALPASTNPTLPAGIDTIVARALAKNRAERYPNGLAFAEDVEDVMAGRPVRARIGLAGEAGRLSRVAVHGRATARLPRSSGTGGWAGAPRLRTWGPGVVLGLGLAVMLIPVAQAPVAQAPGAAPAPLIAAPTPLATASSPAPAAPRPAPAQVALAVEHGFKSGRLKVWVDDSLVLDRALVSVETRSLLFLKGRKGAFAEIVKILPGERRLRLEVVADGARRSAELIGVFRSKETRLLKVKLRGKVQLEWAS